MHEKKQFREQPSWLSIELLLWLFHSSKNQKLRLCKPDLTINSTKYHSSDTDDKKTEEVWIFVMGLVQKRYGNESYDQIYLGSAGI